MDGILLVDKPSGMTSHDVVAKVRRAAGQRDVGHAGTLDPMATGLLIVLLGEATKFSEYLGGTDKTYDARVRFGIETDTLDLDGVVTERNERPVPARGEIERVVTAMIGPHKQVPPIVSAIKIGGQPSYRRARRGEVVEPVARDVVLYAASVTRCEGTDVELNLRVSKGFYVRSFARDLAAGLGTLGTLAALRRTRSGPFEVEAALEGPTLLRAASERRPEDVERVRSAIRPMRDASRSMPLVEVDDAVAEALSHGRAVPWDAAAGPAGAMLIARGDNGPLVCIARAEAGLLKVLRGLRDPAAA